MQTAMQPDLLRNTRTLFAQMKGDRMIQDRVTLQLSIEEEEADTERLDGLTIQMLRDLVEIGADAVERPKPADSTAPGRKGDAFTLGALLLVAAPAILPNLIQYLQAWTLRGENRKIKIKTPQGLEIEFTPHKKLSETELLALVEDLSEVAQKPVEPGAGEDKKSPEKP
jgi:hypothetical protein